jgi:PAS domain S-box-containing protein
MVETAGDVIYTASTRGCFTYVNPRVEKLLGYSPQQIIGRHFTDFVAPLYQQQVETFYRQQYQQRTAETTLEFPLVTASGDDIWIEQIVVLLREGDRVVGFQATVRDITRRKQAEQTLQENEQRCRALFEQTNHDSEGQPMYLVGVPGDITERKGAEDVILQSEANLRRNVERVEAILNSSSDAIILTYPDGTLQQANPAFTNLLGYQADDLFGQPLAVLVAPDYVAVLNEGIASVTEIRQPRRIEVVALRQDRTTFTADAVLSPIAADRRQPPSGIICSLRDITERKQLEAELRQALEKEKEFSGLKTRFVSMASHEFRTPLATIQATSDILRNYLHKMTPEQIAARFDKIQAQVKHMAIMLDDVLALGRFQDGRIEFMPVEIQVEPFCREIVEELRGLHASHELVYTPQLAEGHTRADKKLIRQMITNLLTNAIKYSPPGSTVRFEVTEEEGWLVMRVTDSGIGIPEEDQKHLFEPFHRAANVGEVSGTGLGLTITQQAVELHGGTISCNSTIGVGTTFTISIPLVLADEEEDTQ